MKLDFSFDSKTRSILLGMMGLGALCLIITFLTDSAGHPRFWSNFLHNSVFFTGISFLALFLLCAKAIAYSGWHSQFKRVWEAYSQFLVVGLVLMAFIAVSIMIGWNHVYHWSDAASLKSDTLLQGKKPFLNVTNYLLFSIIIVSIWFFFATRIRAISKDEDVNGTNEYTHYTKLKKWSAAFLPIGGFSSAALVWLWIMSVDAHWYSTLFAWYVTASWLVSMIALTILCLIYLKSKGYYEFITQEHLHDLGKYLFGFSIFWTYLWFSQYMLIWYGNVGEETIYFKERLDNYTALFWMNLAINFTLPLFVLLRNDTKRKTGTLVLIAVFVLFGHWLDFFLMLKPGILHTYHEVVGHGGEHAINQLSESTHAVLASSGGDHGDHGHGHSSFTSGFSLPGLLEIGTFIGFLGLFLYVFFVNLTKAKLLPKNDPYLHESYHHHV